MIHKVVFEARCTRLLVDAAGRRMDLLVKAFKSSCYAIEINIRSKGVLSSELGAFVVY